MKTSSLSRLCLSVLAAAGIIGLISASVPSVARGNLIHEHVNVIAPSYPPANSDNGVTVYTPTGASTVFTMPYSVATASTHAIIVPAVAGKRIRLLGITMSNVSTGTATLETTTANGQLSTYQLAANTNLVLATDKFGYAETNSGDALQMTVTGTTNTVAGNLRYVAY
jgi:hypothetical protein